MAVLSGTTLVLVAVGGAGVAVGAIIVGEGVGSVVDVDVGGIGVSGGGGIEVSVAWTGARGWLGKPCIRFSSPKAPKHPSTSAAATDNMSVTIH